MSGARASVLLSLCVAGQAAGHDLFLKPDAFLLAEKSSVRVRLFNGTFLESENAVTQDRVRELVLVTPGGRMRPDALAWRAAGRATEFAIETKHAGSYVLGVSIKPRELLLSGKDFNAYLREEGLVGVLKARGEARELERPARERYSKHVKALLQVGDARSEVAAPLGHPAEIVPLQNPYSLAAGGALELRCLVDERAAAGLTVFAGQAPRGRIEQSAFTSDALGLVRVPLPAAGRWFVKFVHMRKAGEAGLDYESKWATLTFEVR